MKVSVIVPHLNEPRLAHCLDALEAQTHQDFEVVVVDNGSRDVPLVTRWPHARLITCPRRGSYAARNDGIAATTGDHLAFTDADCIPEPDWLERLDAALAKAPRATGPVPLFLEASRTAAATYDCLFAFTQEANAGAGFGITANMAARRSVFEHVGRFAEVGSIGDREWGERADALGHPIAWVPDAVVHHPARQRLGPLLRKMRRLEGGEADTRTVSTGTRLREGLHVPWPLIKQRRAEHGFGPFATAQGLGVLAIVKGVRFVERLRVAAGGRREHR